MLKRILILLVLVITQAGCTFYEEVSSYKPATFKSDGVESYERLKRDLLQLEDVKVGDGPIAAAGRKVTAEIAVRYNDGSLVYEGPAVSYWGMIGGTFIHNSPGEPGILSLEQQGIVLGLNGMAVGGKRRMTVAHNLVCYGGSVGQSLDKGANPKGTCGLVYGERELVKVRKEQLTIEATLTASCTPIFLRIPLIYSGQFRCRDSDAPKREAGDPIWRFYHAAPAKP